MHVCLFFQLLCHVFEQNAMELIFYYIDLSRNRDVRLAFEAHKVSRAYSDVKRRHIAVIPQDAVPWVLPKVKTGVAGFEKLLFKINHSLSVKRNITYGFAKSCNLFQREYYVVSLLQSGLGSITKARLRLQCP